MPKTDAPPELQSLHDELLAPLYNVVLLDDDDHTFEYVMEMLQRLFLCSKVEAFQHAEEVGRRGRTVVITCELAEAEFGRDQIHAYGPDWRLESSPGSMKAIIEPASNTAD